jgi:uncharacterized protein (TIGR00106 family)
MLAEFSIWPLDNPHMRDEMAIVTEVLDQRNLRYELGAVGTTIEGEWTDVMGAIQACHGAVRAKHDRVLTTVTIDDDATRTQTIGQAKAKVREAREEQHA